MAWTTPRTWTDGELESASVFNPHVRDNLGYLLNRPGQVIKRNNAGAYSTSSLTFVDVDATNLIITLSMAGAVALVGFSGIVINGGGGGSAAFDVAVNGTRFNSGSAFGVWYIPNLAANYVPVDFTVLIPGLTPGSNVFKLQWFGNANTTSLASSAATHLPVFWAQEVS